MSLRLSIPIQTHHDRCADLVGCIESRPIQIVVETIFSTDVTILKSTKSLFSRTFCDHPDRSGFSTDQYDGYPPERNPKYTRESSNILLQQYWDLFIESWRWNNLYILITLSECFDLSSMEVAQIDKANKNNLRDKSL
jgi:hypothetical protein